MDSPLRAVLASFSVLVDDKPLTKLDKRIDKLKDNLWSAGKAGAIALAGIGFGAYKLVEAASHADEALNVLTNTFGSSSAGVVSWSKVMGKELSRSEYMLQDTVGKFGAFLDPIFKDSGQDITEMSKKLTELSVDLASFYNTSDEEAAMRLFSGVSGETEAVRRLGIDISDASLKDLSHKNGDTRAYATLSLAEKTALRFQKILADTEKKQGDAKRTADQWANSSKALQGNLHKLSVEIGRTLIPNATKLLRSLTPYVEWCGKITDRVDVFQVALVGLGTKWAISGAQIVWTNRAVALSFSNVWASLGSAAIPAGIALAFIALGMAIEDLWVFMDGGESVIGQFYGDLMGVQDPLDHFRGVLDQIGRIFHDMIGYTAEVFRNVGAFVSLLPGVGSLMKVLGMNPTFGWDPNVSSSTSEQAANNAEKKRIAVLTRNPEMYRDAMRGSGIGDDAILDHFKKDVALRISLGQTAPTSQDIASGAIPEGMLSSPPPSVYTGGGASGGGAQSVVLNQTVVAGENMSTDELADSAAKKAVELLTNEVLWSEAEAVSQ